jgi:hypothetical protein
MLGGNVLIFKTIGFLVSKVNNALYTGVIKI